jgi:hypothetical protein
MLRPFLLFSFPCNFFVPNSTGVYAKQKKCGATESDGTMFDNCICTLTRKTILDCGTCSFPSFPPTC